MLEVSFSGIDRFTEVCVFPSTLCFLNDDAPLLHFISFPFKQSGILKYDLLDAKYAPTSYLSKCVVRVGSLCEMFPSNLKAREVLKFYSTFFKNQILTGAFLKYFKIDGVLNSKISNLSKREAFLLSLFPLFIKEANIWCVFIKDEILFSEDIKKLESLFISKISNSKGIIFYATESGKSLKFETEICLNR